MRPTLPEGFLMLERPASAIDASPLASFASLGRGDLAPEWVLSGLVARWGLDPATAAARLIVVSENVTFRVERSGTPVMVVRLARPGYALGADHLRSELLWIEALRRDTGVSTPAPVRGADGEALQTLLDDAGNAWSAVAFEFAAGKVLEEHEDIARWFRDIGSVTAVLHEHARHWTPPARFERFGWSLPDLVGPRARWGDWRRAELVPTELRVLEQAEARARQILADSPALRDRGASVGLIHADLRPSNVMVVEGDLTVIDFDDCGHGYFLYDFGAALTFYEHRPEAIEMAAAWLEGYRSRVALTADDVEVACALSMLRRLTMLGWATTHRADSLPPELWDQNTPGTVEVATRFVADPLWLVRAT